MTADKLKREFEELNDTMNMLFDEPKVLTKCISSIEITDPSIRIVYSSGAPLLPAIPARDILVYRRKCKELKKPPEMKVGVYKCFLRGKANVVTESIVGGELAHEFFFTYKSSSVSALVHLNGNDLKRTICINGYVWKNNQVRAILQLSMFSPYLTIAEYIYGDNNSISEVRKSDFRSESRLLVGTHESYFEYDDEGVLRNIRHQSGKFFFKDGLPTRTKI